MHYDFSGHFVEACDCFELCPCWVDDDPDEGHCTGLVAWHIEQGTINGVDVSDRRVVAVTVHGGGRLTSPATTVVHIEPHLPPRQSDALRWAFSGEGDDLRGAGARTDPLAALMRVSGVVLVTIDTQPILIAPDGPAWTVRVGADDEVTVDARGTALLFEEETEPLTLSRSALHRELRIENESTAQRTESIEIAVPALRGGGYVSAKARSGMRGRFRYRYPEKGRGA